MDEYFYPNRHKYEALRPVVMTCDEFQECFSAGHAQVIQHDNWTEYRIERLKWYGWQWMTVQLVAGFLM